MVGGKFTFDRINSKPLTDLLPQLIHLKADQAQATPLQQTLQLLASEGRASGLRLGSSAAAARRYSVDSGDSRAHCLRRLRKTGWLRALSDRQMGAALQSMHKTSANPGRWPRLAASAGMSRSAFAVRFKELVGETPLEYLTRWRIYQAAMLLREGDKKLIDVAHSIGYDSDGAFNKAFKRIMGATPGDYRRNGGALPSLRLRGRILSARAVQMSSGSQKLPLPIVGRVHVARILFGRISEQRALAQQPRHQQQGLW